MNKIIRYKCKETTEKILKHMEQKVEVVDFLDNKPLAHLIRYGNTSEFDNADLTYNWSSRILLAADKVDGRRLMREAGVSIPKTILPGDKVSSLGLLKTFIARPPVHMAGSDFVLIKRNPKKARSLLDNGWYLSEIFKKDRELRVHCAHGRVLLIHDKGIGAETLNSNDQVTTADWWVLNWDDYPMSACVEALKAMDAVGLDFGGVDVLVDRDGNSVVLEINTAPSVPGQIGPTKYARYFDWLLSSTKRREHYDWKKIKTARGFAWRREELK